MVSGSLELVSKVVVQLCPQVVAGWLPISRYALLVKMKDLLNILIELIERHLLCLRHSVWPALTIHMWSYQLDMYSHPRSAPEVKSDTGLTRI